MYIGHIFFRLNMIFIMFEKQFKHNIGFKIAICNFFSFK